MNSNQSDSLRRPRELLGCLVAVGLFALIAIWVLLPAVNSGPPSPRTMSSNNLKQIGLGFQNHHDVKGTLPAGVLVNDAGEWLHGWHTQLLPYIEQSQVYDEIDLSKSWRDPANAQPFQGKIPIFLNPRRHVRLGKAPETVNGLARVITLQMS